MERTYVVQYNKNGCKIRTTKCKSIEWKQKAGKKKKIFRKIFYFWALNVSNSVWFKNISTV